MRMKDTEKLNKTDRGNAPQNPTKNYSSPKQSYQVKARFVYDKKYST